MFFNYFNLSTVTREMMLLIALLTILLLGDKNCHGFMHSPISSLINRQHYSASLFCSWNRIKFSSRGLLLVARKKNQNLAPSYSRFSLGINVHPNDASLEYEEINASIRKIGKIINTTIILMLFVSCGSAYISITQFLMMLRVSAGKT